jgi:hypothetical protein
VQEGATQLLKLRPYKITVMYNHAIQLAGLLFEVGFFNLSSTTGIHRMYI